MCHIWVRKHANANVTEHYSMCEFWKLQTVTGIDWICSENLCCNTRMICSKCMMIEWSHYSMCMLYWLTAVCTQICQNGGTCRWHYFTHLCLSFLLKAICSETCQNGGTCSSPDTCSCVHGWTGNTCSDGLWNVCITNSLVFRAPYAYTV